MLDFGMPAPLAGPLGLLLPLAELLLAVLLLPLATAWWGALGALALLAVFVAGIAASLARGRRPDCHCFGQLHSAPVGWSTLARNAALAAVAIFVVAAGRDDPGLSLTGWLGDLAPAVGITLVVAVLALLAAAVEGFMLVQLIAQNGRLLVRIEAIERYLNAEDTSGFSPESLLGPSQGLPVGTPAPGFRLEGVRGETLTLDALRAAGKPVLLMFMDPKCGPCNALLPEVGRWQREHAAALTVAVVSRGDAEANRAKASEHHIAPLLLQHNDEVSDLYKANATPSAVLVRTDGTIGSPLAAGSDAIEALIAHS